MAFNFTLPLRVAQGILAIIILGLMAYVVSAWNGPYGTSWSPAEANFLLFCAVWTLLAVAYLIVAPARFPTAAHKFGILAAEFVTMIFWFAGFIAFAVLLTDWGCRYGSPCRSSQAATVFGAFEWLLFSATTIMASLHVWRTRNEHSGRHDPKMEVHPSV
jgi:hypothetical protein